jgi:nicotinamide-nucleotide amidase
VRDVTQYPFVFFPVGLNVRGRSCVVIGNDREALEKTESLREIGAKVVRIEDAAQVCDADVVDAFLVISTPHDAYLSERLRALADAHRFLLCCIDQPHCGFVAMQAVVKAGPVRVAISTGGIAPRVGKVLKEALQRSFDTRFVRFIDCMNALRERNRERLSMAQERRAAMIALTDGFSAELTLRYPTWFMEDDAASVLRTLTDLGHTVVTAESITGGGIADALVRVPGASRSFLGGVTAYENALKTRLLDVDEELLRAYGAVSEQTAAAMARGARERLGADFALASTGIAGPTGATPGKPVGFVWFALAQPTGAVDTHSMTFSGDRNAVRRHAVAQGVRFLRSGVERCLGIPRHTGAYCDTLREL